MRKKPWDHGKRCEVSMLKARNVFVPGNIGENRSCNSDFSRTEKQILSFQVCKTQWHLSLALSRRR